MRNVICHEWPVPGIFNLFADLWMLFLILFRAPNPEGNIVFILQDEFGVFSFKLFLFARSFDIC